MAKKHSKKYIEISKKIEKKLYDSLEAFEFLTTNSSKKDSIDIVFVLGIDAKKSDQVIKGVLQDIPHGLGKEVKIAIFSKNNIDELKAAGATFVGFEDLINEIKSDNINADIFLAPRCLMPELAKLGVARILKSKMPNPKTGTVVEEKDLIKAINNQKKGQLAFRSQGHLIQTSIGRASFTPQQLQDNFFALYNAIINSRPQVVKPHSYLQKIFASSTMSPSLQFNLKTLNNKEKN